MRVCDRGPGATEAWVCLEALQRTAPEGSDVIRLVGNHGALTTVTTVVEIKISRCSPTAEEKGQRSQRS